MALDLRRRFVAAAVLVLACAGYAAAPLATASDDPGMVLGHVPTAKTPLVGAVVVGPGGATVGYDTKVVVITQGTALTFVNLDQLAHTVTAVARDSKGNPLFSGNALPGTTTTVAGTDKLAPGTYEFYCQFHPNMQATLIVEGTDDSGTKPATPTFDQKLRLPPVLTGSHLTIPIKEADVQVMPDGPKTAMWTYGGSFPGPTIRRPTGHKTSITFVNKMSSSVGSLSVHLHGDHHASKHDGQPDSELIKVGGRRTYVYPLTESGKPERAAFDFYHDHRMDVTGRNVWNGLQGMFITSDATERKLPLPRGKYDVPLLVNDRTFDHNNQLEEPFHYPGDGFDGTQYKFVGPYAAPGDATVGDRILVNGTYGPHFDVGTHRYRLRLLNGSNFQSYDFKLSNGAPFVQIGTGAGLLPKPVVRDDILLGPAQRADVIVDFSHSYGKKIVLESVARVDDRPGGIGTPTAPIMQFRVNKHVRDDTRIPSKIEPLPKLSAPSTPSTVWTFGLGGDINSGTYWTINGQPYDPTRVDAVVPQGSTQTWLLQNLSPITHYIHLHEEGWQTITRDGLPAPPEEAVADVWRLDPGESVTVAAKFTDYPGIFMNHCHMLDHEDHGMMAQFAVTKPGTSLLPPGYHTGKSGTAPISSDAMSGMARRAMASMASMSTPVNVPTWMHLVVRAGWALSVELPLFALVLLWRRRRSLESVVRRAALVLMLAGVALTHASDLLGKLWAAPYLAVGFGGLIVGSGLAAIALATARRTGRIEAAVAAASALTVLGYVVSRTIGLPQIHNHIGHWADPWGTASLVVEVSLVVLVMQARSAWMRMPRVRLAPAWRGVQMNRPRWIVAMVTALAATATAIGGVPSEAAAKHQVLLVCNGTVKCPDVNGVKYYKSLQLAVDHARNGDWVLVWPGTYKEATTIEPGHGLTDGLHIRGMNRNGVVLEGKKATGSGIWVHGVNNTWVENMTGQNYQSGSANAFYWTSVDGYWGNYLTAYNNGDYGLYAFDSTSSGKVPSTFAHDYASWNADSGIYVGGCRDCNAVVVDSKSEKNALGYSGTNAGGELYLMESEWDHNATGILPNTLQSEPDLPQRGAFIVNNYVHDNNDHDVPGAGITGIAPVGVGIGIAGGSDNIVRGNLITNQKHNGVGLFWLFTPPMNNQILSNVFKKAHGSQPGDADISFDGSSLENCVDGNVDKTGGHTKPASTDPPNLANTQNCGSTNPLRGPGPGLYGPGDPLYSIVTALNAVGITEPKDYKGPGPRPGAMMTMPNPCKGAPANPWCENGKPKFDIPTSA